MDQVANHCGLNHWWMSDLPFSNWVNYQDRFEAGKPIINSNHRRTTNQDGYASAYQGARIKAGSLKKCPISINAIPSWRPTLFKTVFGG